MKTNIQEALNNVDMTYSQLIDIANDITSNVMGDIDILMQNVYTNIENLDNDSIRQIMVKIAFRSYSFSEIKEKALFKAKLAEAIRNENYSVAFGVATGTAEAKKTQATMEVSEEILSQELYTLVANLFKIKLDELHRCVDALKTTLMSRLSEAKLNQIEA